MRSYGWLFDCLDELSRYTRETGLMTVEEKVREVKDALSNVVDAQTIQYHNACLILPLASPELRATHLLDDPSQHQNILPKKEIFGTVIDFAIFLNDRTLDFKNQQKTFDEKEA